MTYNLLTRDEANNIVENTDTFYKTVTVVEGYNVEMYDYRLASHSDFINNNAYELRGLTFVEVEPNVWERNLLMDKFFNVNQVSGGDAEYIITLEDGSTVNFKGSDKVILTNGKSKMVRDLVDGDDIVLC